MTRRRFGRAWLGLVLVGGLVAATPSAAHAAPEPPGKLPTGRSWTVTLLTGDVVKVRTVKGRPPLVSTTPGAGRRNKLFRTTFRPDGHVIVTPADVAGLVGKVLDPGLFDVTTLIGQGYDDARSADLPLIVQRAPGVRAQSALGGTLREERDLPSIGAVAARQPKKQAGRLGSALGGMRAEGGGIRHVWLDHKVKSTAAPAELDHNLRQVGAPAAWQAGFDGRGVKVAVLDTGVDAGHPDLVSRIGETKNFSESVDTIDRFGHGTHVAATIAGTGKAAGGERTGVAPAASLLIGKVLGDDGYGETSDIISGAEWAAERAKVVNVSLGGWEPSDGTDPLSAAVDRLTEQHGSLFVVSAGNEGTLGEISSPAAAESALTVGAVDSADKLAGFSSRGPRPGRYAAKPEIVAPGVDIVAARAAGTTMGRPLDARYTMASGTSMAAPHVAGAAAMLVQRHPGWTAAQLKAALAGSADPATGGDPYERGIGRLNAGTAVNAPVVSATGVVHLGTAAYPQSGTLTTKLAWTARKTTTLALSVHLTGRQGRPAAGAAKLSAAQVTVPADGTATVTLQIDPVKLAGKPGLYAAEVKAENGPTTLVTFLVEPPSHTLTIKAAPFPGTPEGAFAASASVINLADVVQFARWTEVAADGSTRIRVPRGPYSVLGAVADSTDGAVRWALGGKPEVMIDRDVTVTIDGAGAKELKASVQGRTTSTAMVSTLFAQANAQALWSDGLYTEELGKERLYVQPTGRVRTGTFRTYGMYRMTAPGNVWDVLHPMGDRFPADPSYVITPARQAEFARVDQRFAAFDGDTGKSVGEKRYGTTPEGFLAHEALSDVPAASTRTDYLSHRARHPVA